MKPRGLLGITIIFWGLQTELLLAAIPMAIIYEARHYFNRRWDLTKEDFYRVSDLTAVGLGAMILFLFLNARSYHFVITMLQWLPFVFYPLTIVFAYSTTERMPLDVLFRSLRKQKEPVKQSWDMNYLLLGTVLVGAATNTRDLTTFFFPFAAFVVLAALYPLRTRRFDLRPWLLAGSVVIITSVLTHQGLRSGHLYLKARSEQLIANWLNRRLDPMKTRTELGRVGQLKLSDEILFRVDAPDGVPFPRLMHEAAYDQPVTREKLEWIVNDRSFDVVPHHDDFEWRFTEVPGPRARVYLEFERERQLVPVPDTLASLIELPAIDVATNPYGAIQGRGLVLSPHYDLTWEYGRTIYSPPGPYDTNVPEDFKDVLQRVPVQSGKSNLGSINNVRAFFQDFTYSLYQEDFGSGDPLEDFLFNRRKGHCEYFASATTLMLRQLGVPARYVVGYAVQEYSPALGMYVVRQRHGHAWAIAWTGEEWQVVDTTPAVWAAEEQEAMNLFRPFVDYVANQNFLFQRWWNDQKIEDYEIHLYVLGGILTLVLIWRIATSEQVVINRDGTTADGTRLWPGLASPLYRAEAALNDAGLFRDQGEVWEAWLRRIDEPELAPLVSIHNRWRFDPEGISDDDRNQLETGVESWLDGFAERQTAESSTEDSAS